MDGDEKVRSWRIRFLDFKVLPVSPALLDKRFGDRRALKGGRPAQKSRAHSLGRSFQTHVKLFKQHLIDTAEDFFSYPKCDSFST